MRRVAIVFPGQGSQHAGMLESIPELDSFGRLIDAAEALSELPLRQIVAGDHPDLTDTRVAQPLLYLVDWAWGRTLLDSGIVPDVVAGHSLGEIAALAVADVFSVEAGLELVVERSRLMAQTAAETPGGMAAVLGLDGDVLAATVRDIENIWVANDNALGQVVISGTHRGLELATETLVAAGARRVVPLAVSGPFHSPLMQPAADRFATLLEQADFRDASVPVLSNAQPVPTTYAEEIRTRLTAQIVSPVRWTETMRAITASGDAVIIEAGPGTVLRGLARKIEGATAFSVEDTSLEDLVEEVV